MNPVASDGGRNDRDERFEYLSMMLQYLEREVADLKQRVIEVEAKFGKRGKRREERNEGEKAGEGSPAD